MGVKHRLTIQEVNGLGVLESNLLRRISGPKREKLTAECRE
jgi:hypothetical protein